MAIEAIARREDLDEEQRSARVVTLRSGIGDQALLGYYKNGVVQHLASRHATGYDPVLRLSILKALSPDSVRQVAMYRKIIADGTLTDPEKRELLSVLPEVGS